VSDRFSLSGNLRFMLLGAPLIMVETKSYFEICAYLKIFVLPGRFADYQRRRTSMAN
jgi:hypothetical protein